MPIYDARLNRPDPEPPTAKGIIPGAAPFPRFDGEPGVLKDANGVVIDCIVFWCNTETGLVGHGKGPDGKFRFDQRDGRLVVIETYFPAPLTCTRRVDNQRVVTPEEAKAILLAMESNVEMAFASVNKPVKSDLTEEMIRNKSIGRAIRNANTRIWFSKCHSTPTEVVEGTDSPTDEPFIVGG